jgi:hypothetical protein
MKGLLLVYYNRMFASPIMDFEQLCNIGMRIEDVIDSDQIDKNEGKISAPAKKNFESTSKLLPMFKPISMQSNQANINTNLLSIINIRIYT